MTGFKAMASVCVLVGGLLAGTASADINIATVTVGNAGNAADTTGYGSVGYSYSIGKYEVTAAQYTAFLNTVAKTDTYGLYNTLMSSETNGCKIQRTGVSGSYTYSVASDYANRPVNFVSYWDSCRFANWLSNGQGNGSTETGTYTLTTGGINANTVTRNDGWKWAVTSEDEWYKAAYYDPNKSGGADYWDYATRSDTINTTMANYNMSVGHTTDVGSYYAYSSSYGTFDQGGNVWEWNEGLLGSRNNYRGLRGGSYGTIGTGELLSSNRDTSSYYGWSPLTENHTFGFRVSSATVTAVPAPGAALLGLIGLSIVGWVKRRFA